MSTDVENEFRQAVEEFADGLNDAVDRIAAAMGWAREDVVHNLQALRDYRCWKKIPQCFNGWGVGICALPGGHDGDCNPIPRRG